MLIPKDPDALLTREQTAVALTEAGFPVSQATLSTKATRGGGPPFQKFGPRAMYRWGPTLQWAKDRLRDPVRSTSETELAAKLRDQTVKSQVANSPVPGRRQGGSSQAVSEHQRVAGGIFAAAVRGCSAGADQEEPRRKRHPGDEALGYQHRCPQGSAGEGGQARRRGGAERPALRSLPDGSETPCSCPTDRSEHLGRLYPGAPQSAYRCASYTAK
jgi:hypothetical protein